MRLASPCRGIRKTPARSTWYRCVGLLLSGIVVSSQHAVAARRKQSAPPASPRAVSEKPGTLGRDRAVLWRDPVEIASRDLLFGPGGREHLPHEPFTFVQEDPAGSNPKFVVRDKDGVKWKVKLGTEARPETVASRLVWAVGYAAPTDYFLPEMRVDGMPSHLHRGQHLVGHDGTIRNVRVKRELADGKKLGTWKWRDNPFSGTRELNGLRALMAVINNWDLKDINNLVYEERHGGPTNDAENAADGDLLIYEVSDLGCSFGSAGLQRTTRTKGDLNAYRRTPFIKHLTLQTVDFDVPRRADWIVLANVPEFAMRLHLRWIGRGIPRDDARWMGRLLAALTPDQIRDAFRAAAYSPAEIDEFSDILETRIAELNRL